MEIKIIVVLLAVFLLGTFFFITFYSDYLTKHPKQIPTQYQGPVPEGYDEEHFRQTGETKLK